MELIANGLICETFELNRCIVFHVHIAHCTE